MLPSHFVQMEKYPMNTQTQNTQSVGEFIHAHLHAIATLERDLEAETKEFCAQWQNLVGIPTTKSGITQMMRRSLVVLGVNSHANVEPVLAEIRQWLAGQWLSDTTISLATATKRWAKACRIEDVILVDYI